MNKSHVQIREGLRDSVVPVLVEMDAFVAFFGGAISEEKKMGSARKRGDVQIKANMCDVYHCVILYLSRFSLTI